MEEDPEYAMSISIYSGFHWMEIEQYITLMFCAVFAYVLMTYIFESRFQTRRYREHPRGLGIKIVDPPELNFHLRRLKEGAALVVDPDDTLQFGHYQQKKFHIRAGSIFLEGLL